MVVTLDPQIYYTRMTMIEILFAPEIIGILIFFVGCVS